MLVSLIIPVYNVESFLKRCLESAQKQTYRDIEIILVDDGSTDSSGEMCDAVANTDKRIKVIHKKNGGLSSARNAGIAASNGECIFLLDSDDYISSTCIELCVKMLAKYNADISIVQMANVTEETNEEIPFDKNPSIEVFSAKDAIKESLYQQKFSCSAPGKLYKKHIFKDVLFPEGRLSEDLATCHLFFRNANKIVYTDQYAYYYRQREHSIMHTFNPKRLDAIEWAEDIEDFCSKNYPDIMDACLCRSFNVAIHLLLDLPNKGKAHDKYKPQIWNTIKRTRFSVLKNRRSRGREKAAAILSFFGERMLKKIWFSRFTVKRKNYKA